MVEKTDFVSLSSKDVLQKLLTLKQLVFEVTDSCNLKCKYCGYGEFYCSYDQRKQQMLSLPMAKRLLDYIFDLWKEHGVDIYKHDMTFGFYGGEPLLNVDFIRSIQDYIENKYTYCLNIGYSMTTNAMLLDRYMDFIVEKNFQLLISLDGDEKGQSYRVDHSGHNSFERVFRNVKLLQKTHPDYFEKKVQFNAVLHDRNSVESVYRFIKEEFGKIPKISPLNTSGIREEKREDFQRMFVDREQDFNHSSDLSLLVQDMFYDAPGTRELYSYLENYSGNIYRTYNDLFADTSRLSIVPTGTCLPFERKMYLTVNGKILPCERIDQKYVLGYVSEESVDLDFEKIAIFYNRLYGQVKQQCQSCYRKQFCPQCAFYLPEKEGKRECYGYMDQKNFEKMVIDQKDYLRKNPRLYERIIKELAIY